MTIKWERDTVPGVYWRQGTSGRKLFRHVYRNTEGKQVACSKHQNVTSARKHQREMVVIKPQPITRATLRETYEQHVADAEYADATLAVHGAAWKHIQHLADVPAGKVTHAQVTAALESVPGSEMRSKVRYLLTTLGAPAVRARTPNTRARKMQAHTQAAADDHGVRARTAGDRDPRAVQSTRRGDGLSGLEAG